MSKSTEECKIVAELAYANLKDAIMEAANSQKNPNTSESQQIKNSNIIEEKKEAFVSAVKAAFLSGVPEYGSKGHKLYVDDSCRIPYRHLAALKSIQGVQKSKTELLDRKDVDLLKYTLPTSVAANSYNDVSGFAPKTNNKGTNHNLERHVENCMFALGMSAISMTSISRETISKSEAIESFIEKEFMQEMLSVVTAKRNIDAKSARIVNNALGESRNNGITSTKLGAHGNFLLTLEKFIAGGIGLLEDTDEALLSRISLDAAVADHGKRFAHPTTRLGNTFAAVCYCISNSSTTPLSDKQNEVIAKLIEKAQEFGYNVKTSAQLASIYDQRAEMKQRFEDLFTENQQERSVPRNLMESIKKRDNAYTDIQNELKNGDAALLVNPAAGAIDYDLIATAVNAIKKCGVKDAADDPIALIVEFANSVANNRGGGSTPRGVGAHNALPNSDFVNAIGGSASHGALGLATAAATTPPARMAREAIDAINNLSSNELRVICNYPERAKIVAALQEKGRETTAQGLVGLYHGDKDDEIFLSADARKNRPVGCANSFVKDLKTHKNAFDEVENARKSALGKMESARKNPNDVKKHIEAVKALTQLPVQEFVPLYKSDEDPSKSILKSGEKQIARNFTPAPMPDSKNLEGYVSPPPVAGLSYFPLEVTRYLLDARDKYISSCINKEALQTPSMRTEYRTIELQNKQKQNSSGNTTNVNSQSGTASSQSTGTNNTNEMNITLTPGARRRMNDLMNRDKIPYRSSVRSQSVGWAVSNNPRRRIYGPGASLGRQSQTRN